MRNQPGETRDWCFRWFARNRRALVPVVSGNLGRRLDWNQGSLVAFENDNNPTRPEPAATLRQRQEAA